jgi:hypothetical protein
MAQPDGSDARNDGFLENVREKLGVAKDKAKDAFDKFTKPDKPPTADRPSGSTPPSSATQPNAPVEPTIPVGPETVVHDAGRHDPTDNDPLPIADQPPKDPGGA